jgi:hypothetical protein
MEMLSKAPVPSQPKHWPNLPAQRGVVYQTKDPVHQGEVLAVMSLQTWLDFGTEMEALKRKAAAAEKAAVQLKMNNDVLVESHAKMHEKYTNLKESERARRTKAAGKMFDLSKK